MYLVVKKQNKTSTTNKQKQNKKADSVFMWKYNVVSEASSLQMNHHSLIWFTKL